MLWSAVELFARPLLARTSLHMGLAGRSQISFVCFQALIDATLASLHVGAELQDVILAYHSAVLHASAGTVELCLAVRLKRTLILLQALIDAALTVFDSGAELLDVGGAGVFDALRPGRVLGEKN
jgi:hypothetical protein